MKFWKNFEEKYMREIKIMLVSVLFLILFSLIVVGTHNQKKEEGMCGIIFFKTQKLAELKDFYLNEVGCELWMDQKDCLIFKSGNMLFGFCQREEVEPGGMVTFFYEKKEAVDKAYKKFKSIAISSPRMNEKYQIYHFFARDPEGRYVEFQYFDSKIDWNFSLYK
jgi:hypothetical protein